MSMSHYVQGVIPPDEKFKQMLAVYQACKTAGVSPPVAVVEFFDDCRPDPAGVILDSHKLNGAVKEWNDDYASGYEIDLTRLPPHVKKIRTLVSW